MVRLDGVLVAVLALVENIAFAVAVWVSAALVIGGSVVAGLLALAVIGLGSVVVVGFVRL